MSKRLTREICVDSHINVQRCPHYNKANPTKYFLSACNLYHKTQRGEGATDPYKAVKSRHDLSLSLSLPFTHHTHTRTPLQPSWRIALGCLQRTCNLNFKLHPQRKGCGWLRGYNVFVICFVATQPQGYLLIRTRRTSRQAGRQASKRGARLASMRLRDLGWCVFSPQRSLPPRHRETCREQTGLQKRSLWGGHKREEGCLDFPCYTARTWERARERERESWGNSRPIWPGAAQCQGIMITSLRF